MRSVLTMKYETKVINLVKKFIGMIIVKEEREEVTELDLNTLFHFDDIKAVNLATD